MISKIKIPAELNCAENVGQAVGELFEAHLKHPKFCDAFTQLTKEQAVYIERMLKKENAPSRKQFADKILLEEIAEARTAWLEGNKKHCKQELAQCVAVCLRMMAMCDK